MPTSISPRGLLTDSFLLTVEKSIIVNKGNIAAQNPAWWGVPLIDLGKSVNSKLYVMITAPMQKKFAQISINASIINYSPKKTGEFQMRCINGSKTVVVKQSVVTNASFINYTFKTPTFDSTNNPIIEFFSADFDDIAIKEVMVEIYNPIVIPGGK